MCNTHIYIRICIQYILLYLHIYRAELQWFANTHPFQATNELWQRRCWDMGSELVYDNLTPEKFGQFAIATLTIPIISSGVCQWHHYHSLSIHNLLAELRHPAFFNLARSSPHSKSNNFARTSRHGTVLLDEKFLGFHPWLSWLCSSLKSLGLRGETLETCENYWNFAGNQHPTPSITGFKKFRPTRTLLHTFNHHHHHHRANSCGMGYIIPATFMF